MNPSRDGVTLLDIPPRKWYGVSMKYIFLDVDGVLNNYTMLDQFDRCEDGKTIEEICTFLGRDHVARLNQIIVECGGPAEVQVIISATMRKNYTLEELQEALRVMGCECKVVDRTGKSHRGGADAYPRADEIREYLQKHPEIKEFLVLDDSPMNGLLAEFHVRSSWTTGLLDEHVEDAINKLLYPKHAWSNNG